MCRFVKEIFVSTVMFFGCSVSNVNWNCKLKCVLMSNQECKVSSEIVDVNSNEPIFYPCSIEVNK